MVPAGDGLSHIFPVRAFLLEAAASHTTPFVGSGTWRDVVFVSFRYLQAGLLLSNGATGHRGHSRLPGWARGVIICLVGFMVWFRPPLKKGGVWGGKFLPINSDYSPSNR